MERWELMLEHAKAERDALVACGNPAPTKPDPPGGMVPVSDRRYKAKEYWSVMKARGHTSVLFETCACRLKAE